METVILLTQHDLNGTAGLIINRPTQVKLSDIFPNIKEQPKAGHFTYIGGPVGLNQVQLLIRSRGKPEESQWIFDDVYVSSSKAALEKLLKNPQGEAKFRVYAGYAGWLPGQLKLEMSRGDWRVIQADAGIIFNKGASEIWPELIRQTEVIRIQL